jgi:hypothetical protein
MPAKVKDTGEGRSTNLLVIRALFALAATVAVTSAAPQVLAQDPPAATAAPADNPVSPDAVAAIHRMGAYLGTLQNFEMTADTSRDLVTVQNQRLDLDGVTTYRIRRPNGFVIDNRTTRKERKFIYDGQRFTVYAPTRNYYATVDAPPTIGEVLAVIYERYGLELPLEDIFHWGDPANLPQDFESATHVGVATINGVQTDHYAFRQPELDWQVWIQQGPEPRPLKIAIIDRTDPALPEFTAHLRWDVNPAFNDRTFAFAPDGDDKPIRFVDYE